MLFFQDFHQFLIQSGSHSMMRLIHCKINSQISTPVISSAFKSPGSIRITKNSSFFFRYQPGIKRRDLLKTLCELFERRHLCFKSNRCLFDIRIAARSLYSAIRIFILIPPFAIFSTILSQPCTVSKSSRSFTTVFIKKNCMTFNHTVFIFRCADPNTSRLPFWLKQPV